MLLFSAIQNFECFLLVRFNLHFIPPSIHPHLTVNLISGNNVLGSLYSQRDTLKGAHKRILDIGNTLGLSNHTMKLIERRIHEDKYVVFGGMAVTTLIIIGVIYYFVL